MGEGSDNIEIELTQSHLSLTLADSEIQRKD